MRALDSAVPHGCPEPRRRPQSVQKIALVLEKSPKKLQPDLVALVPKLVDSSEHSLAACALLDHLQKPDTEPSLRLPVRFPICHYVKKNVFTLFLLTNGYTFLHLCFYIVTTVYQYLRLAYIVGQ